jgi:hypothetical protein
MGLSVNPDAAKTITVNRFRVQKFKVPFSSPNWIW